MAVSLVKNKLATVINNSDDFVQFLTPLNNPSKLKIVSENMGQFLSEQKQASDAIIEAIFTHD